MSKKLRPSNEHPARKPGGRWLRPYHPMGRASIAPLFDRLIARSKPHRSHTARQHPRWRLQLILHLPEVDRLSVRMNSHGDIEALVHHIVEFNQTPRYIGRTGAKGPCCYVEEYRRVAADLPSVCSSTRRRTVWTCLLVSRSWWS